MSHGCTEGYCGPFWISRVYWVDAGRPTLPDDQPNRREGEVTFWLSSRSNGIAEVESLHKSVATQVKI